MASIHMRQKLPQSVKSRLRPVYVHLNNLRYELFLRRLGINKKQILILATITKSGTHYMRFLLANYLKQLRDVTEGPVSPSEIDVMFPNGWHKAYLRGQGYKVPTPLLALLGLHDVPRSHIQFQQGYWDRSRVLHLYRNPLDFAVSLYIYKYEYYKHFAGTIEGPVEVLKRHFDEYARMYLSFRQAARAENTSLLSMAYEDLVRFPDVCLGTTLRWLGIEPQPSKVEAAVQYASTNVTALVGAGEIWQRNGTVASNPQMIADFTDKLVREGSIGHWKGYFRSSDLHWVQERLGSFGLNLHDFILEP